MSTSRSNAGRDGRSGRASKAARRGALSQQSLGGSGSGTEADPKAGVEAGGRADTKASASRRARYDVSELASAWGPTVGRVLLGLVLAWFGYHELIQPAVWAGYVPFVHKASAGAVVAVLAHGWILLVLAAALIAGIMIRAAAAAAALLLAEIVIWLTVTAGLSDLTLRDVGVLGLALCLSGATRQRLTLAS
jgi:uncharacterized membrane protein YphA (DoxX/SURF4 family)